VKCSASKHLLTDILKHEMGFEGFLISDYNAIDQISPNYKKDVAISINAGIDMVMLTEKYPELFSDLQQLASDGSIPMTRIDDAVTRILRVKFAMGLMDKTAPRWLIADYRRLLARPHIGKSHVRRCANLSYC